MAWILRSTNPSSNFSPDLAPIISFHLVLLLGAMTRARIVGLLVTYCTSHAISMAVAILPHMTIRKAHPTTSPNSPSPATLVSHRLEVLSPSMVPIA